MEDETKRRAGLDHLSEDERPIRFELFSPERFEEHAASLAAAQKVDNRTQGRKLMSRVRDNVQVLAAAHAAISQAVAEPRAITPAAEWLLDNFHIVEEQVRDIRIHLPEGYYRELPKLADGFLAGYPRVYGIGWALISHTDSRFDPALTTLFVKTYQRTQRLTLGELWAIPITLRVLLLENLRRLAVLINNSQSGRRLADRFVDVLERSEEPGGPAASVQTSGRLPPPAMRQAFAVQMSQRMHDPHLGATPSLDFLNEWLADQELTIDDVVHREHADQIAANASVRNIMTSMRVISAFDWREFVEQVSLVEGCLRAHDGYVAADFLTRDRYRHAVEDLARRSPHEELEIARRVMSHAENADKVAGCAATRRDPGYYLIGPGRAAFERAVGFRPTARQRVLRFAIAHAGPVYLGAIAALTLGLLAVLLMAAMRAGLSQVALGMMALFGAFPASDIATGLVNRMVLALLPPHHLPRLELKSGVPESLRTCVVVPTLFVTEAGVRDQVEQMEIRYLANPDGEVHFALLSDWADADEETLPDDASLLNRAVIDVAALNQKYAGGRFHLFHRRRQWNPSERKWMGWERKRGKLHEFNRLLRGAIDTSFVSLVGIPPAAPLAVRFVITLDADTRLPIGVVNQLVGTAAHPLNQPVFDPAVGRVTAGYAILQPRVTPTLPLRRERSLFHRIFAGASGTDAYASQVSEVYQDLFGLGTYSGKGLYDVDVFEAALAGRVPDNTQLSHDLFESVFARCGLVSDIEFFEEFPSHTAVADSRTHRWTRGDWQLLPWIFGTAGGTLPFVGRWKMLDNLRRSLSAPGAVLTLLLAWTLPGAPQVMLIGLVLTALAMPAVLTAMEIAIPPGAGVTWRNHFRAIGENLAVGLAHGLIGAAFLAQQAWLMAHAIGSTLVRVLVTRRKLLNWVTALQAKANAGHALQAVVRPLGNATAMSLATGGLVVFLNPPGLLGAAPFLLLWWTAPLIARVLSLPPRLDPIERLHAEDIQGLRLIGRRTWRFFTRFVTLEEHHLPPDNFQEDPNPVIAHRSSPTNFGLYLLAVLTARDFGWISRHDAVERLEATLATLVGLPRLRGHFYNWYDTLTLRELEPRYVSTVDSGNLAGHLLTLAQGCREAAGQRPDVSVAWQGLGDTQRLLSATLASIGEERRSLTVTLTELRQQALILGEILAGAPTDAAWARLTLGTDVLLDLAQAYTAERNDESGLRALEAVGELRDEIAAHRRDLDDVADLDALSQRLNGIAAEAERLFNEMDFAFLYDHDQHLFALGYRAGDDVLDDSYYDQLASEARLTSLVAIAKRDVGSEHWFHLGRRVTRAAGGSVLLSWSGSMFEYLMPSLVSYTPRYSLLDQTCRQVVKRQIEYGREQDVPWGVSESALNQRDVEFTYQYSAFGVPGLGMKRGLADDLVIAPYASALAAMYQPHAAMRNYARLEELGGLGHYGFYEALDFTPARLAENQRVAVVRCYMAHHQGMSLVALSNVLHDGVMRQRFHAIPLIRATELLLQERSPRGAETQLPRFAEARSQNAAIVQPPMRRRPSPTSAVPSSQLLSNGRYTVMVTAAGSGYSAWENLAITRWREDTTRDNWGSYLYLRDLGNGRTWSAGYQPTTAAPDLYEASFLEDRVRITRTDGAITSALEILVSPEDDAEIRRLSLTNNGSRRIEIEMTSYSEIVLAPLRADVAHPAFSNLFVQTEYLPQSHCLLARRRPRSAQDPVIWAAHLLCGQNVGDGMQYETDRARFIGRGRSLKSPIALMDGCPLSNTVGAVLDPIFSLRARARIEAGGTVHLTFATLAAPSREVLEKLIDKYRQGAMYERVSSLAWTHAQIQLHHLRIRPEEAQLFQALANHLLFADPSLRPPGKFLQLNQLNVTGLWRHGISGDRPIVLLFVTSTEHRTLVEQLLRATEYWYLKRFAVDLVIVNAKEVSYIEEVQAMLEGLVRDSTAYAAGHGPAEHCSVFVLRGDQLSDAEILLLKTAARVVLSTGRGTLAEQLLNHRRPALNFVAPSRVVPPQPAVSPLAMPELEFFNGLGGFAEDGREYVIVLDKGQWTPAPWINVIANPDFGFMVSESGGGCTWSQNSHENQLTPWSNDPISDPPGEVFYIADEASGDLWTPTALPIRVENTGYVIRHGQGYSCFEHTSHGIASELLQMVALEDPVKISRLTLHNRSARSRRLRVAVYVEWVLGATRTVTAPYLVTEADAETGALLATNPWSQDFGGRVAFADLAGRQTAWTGSRGEFIGRNGSLAAPAALGRPQKLRNRTGAGLDPCAALETTVELQGGEQIELVFLLGQGDDRAHAVELVRRYRAADVADLLAAVRRQWDAILEKVQVKTPDRGLDLMLNRWLPYQTLSCRIWARAAFYQAGGAYGYRDQLQDVMALAVSRPDLTRAHLLRAAARQFAEGDVQHWWHPPTGRGVRTHFSDDRVWLPYVVAHYVRVSGDRGVLDEVMPFLDGPPLPPGESDAYFDPTLSRTTANLFEHCARAIDISLGVGAHGLPLIGSGDWNDGMNRVGHLGKGESVWLAWFLIATLGEFASLAEARGDSGRAVFWRSHAAMLKTAVEAEAWDGAWYRRAYFDDGTPLGSAANAECRIDSLAQSWGVISGAADPERAQRAMHSVHEYLIRHGDDLVLLFTPPFDQTSLDPGYIKGYLPGVRENGGQYTHAAVWSVIAYAMLGQGDQAAELLRMLNPIHRAASRTGTYAYKVEPYVLSADIYAEPPHARRGGWTWYTGASGWFYRAGLESVLGLQVQAGRLHFDPCIPRAWLEFSLTYRHGAARYDISVTNPHGVMRGVARLDLDGDPQADTQSIGLVDDGQIHQVSLVLVAA